MICTGANTKKWGTFWHLPIAPILRIQKFSFGILIFPILYPPARKLDNPYYHTEGQPCSTYIHKHMYNYLEARYILFLFHLFLFVFADFIINRKLLLHFKIKNINEEFFLPQYEPNIVKISDLYCQNWTVQCCDYISKMNDFFCSIMQYFVAYFLPR